MVLTFRHRRASGYEFTTDDRAEGAARAGPGAGPRLPAEAVGAVEVAVVVEAADVANHDQAYVAGQSVRGRQNERGRKTKNAAYTSRVRQQQIVAAVNYAPGPRRSGSGG